MGKANYAKTVSHWDLFYLFDPCRTASGDCDVLIKHDTTDELRVFYGTANPLDDTDIS